MADYEMTLHNPLTVEEWDLITDASLDNTNEITFITKQGKEVKFIKASADVRENVRGKWSLVTDRYGINGESVWKCSACSEMTICKGDFCPNCGCLMKEKKDERNQRN